MWSGVNVEILIACEQALLFGRVKRVSRERASERRSREGPAKGELASISHKFSFPPRKPPQSVKTVTANVLQIRKVTVFYPVEFNRAKKSMLENSAWITLHFHSPGFQNYTKCLTQTNTTQWWRVFIVLPQELQTRSDLSSARNILFTRITSNEPVCLEGWNKFSVPIWSPWEPNLTHRRSGCQLSLLAINFDFRNVIFQPMVFPFVWEK